MKRRNFIKKASATIGALFALPFLGFGKKQPPAWMNATMRFAPSNYTGDLTWNSENIYRIEKVELHPRIIRDKGEQDDGHRIGARAYWAGPLEGIPYGWGVCTGNCVGWLSIEKKQHQSFTLPSVIITSNPIEYAVPRL